MNVIIPERVKLILCSLTKRILACKTVAAGRENVKYVIRMFVVGDTLRSDI